MCRLENLWKWNAKFFTQLSHVGQCRRQGLQNGLFDLFRVNIFALTGVSLEVMKNNHFGSAG